MKSRGLFIAGSGMNAGKTTFSLGLISWLHEIAGAEVSFMKPLGQKTTLVDGESVGEDTFLVNTSLGLTSELQYTAPFAMSSGASERFLSEGQPSDIPGTIAKAYKHLKSESEFIVVEGTGHPGVGSVFGLCNASVAGLLGIPVLMVLNGGIGSTIDRFTLCNSLFHDRNIPVIGVVVNRVQDNKMEKVRSFLDPWFEQQGMKVFGYIPYLTSIARPSLGMIGRELGMETVISIVPDAGNPVEGFITGFGSAGEIIDDIRESPESALIISSTRCEVIDAVISRRLSGSITQGPGAIVLCGGNVQPDSHVASACRELDIPLYVTSRSAGDSSSILKSRIFKVEPGESVKISEIVRTIREHVDLQGILDVLDSDVSPKPPPRPGTMTRIRSWLRRLTGGR